MAHGQIDAGLTVKLLIMNLNLSSDERGGCEQIASALAVLRPHACIDIVHFAQVQARVYSLSAVDGVILGPQGSPFSQYPSEFLPWLADLVQALSCPVLAICGGMQALALALGGHLEAVDGSGPIDGPNYVGRAKITGLVAISIDADTLPAWLLTGWQGPIDGEQCMQSHCEQIGRLPPPLQAIAHSAVTPVEAFVHPHRRWLGCQFHPERGWQAGGSAGKLWLRAWLATVDAR